MVRYFWMNIGVLGALSACDHADPAPKGLVGSGGKKIFAMDAGREGSSDLACSYQRSPSDVIETRIFIGHVNVEQMQ